MYELSTNLWQKGSFVRSRECSPLYVERYHGPRVSPAAFGHPFWEMTAVVSGGGELRMAQPKEMLPGSIILLPPRCPHREHAPEGMDTIWIGLRGTRLAGLSRTPVMVRDEHLVAEIERLWLFTHQATGPIGAEIDGATLSILGRFLRLSRDTVGRGSPDLIDSIIRFMHEHLEQPIDVGTLARRTGCSEGYFSRMFRQATGSSPMQFLIDLRTRQAANLLQQSGLSVSTIAQRAGFSSLFYFSRVFRQRMGMSPRAYRRLPNRNVRQTAAPRMGLPG